MLDKLKARAATGLPGAEAARAGDATRAFTKPIVHTLVAVCVGIVLFGTSARRSVPGEGVPLSSPAGLIGQDAMASATLVLRAASATLPRQEAVSAALSHGDADDQPAGACWLANVGGASSCLCSVGTVEDVLTPEFMRVLLQSWGDAGRLTTGEVRARLQEVDTGCAPREAGIR